MIRYLRYALLMVGLLLISTAYSQRAQDWITLGDRAMESNDPYGALRYYENAMQLDSAKALHNYLYAEALRLNHQYAKAAFYYHKVYRRDRGKVYPEGPGWLATMLKQSGDFAEAKRTWRRVRDQYAKEPNGFWYQKAVQEMRASDLAMEWMKDTVPFELEPLPEKVNSEASEFAGVFRDDGSLVFSSLRGSFDHQGRLQSEEKEYRVALFETDTALIGVKRISMQPDENLAEANFASGANWTAYVTKNEAGENAIRIFSESGSTYPIILPQENDSAYYSHPAFGRTDHDEVLFFSSDRDGGFGGFDIWYLSLSHPESMPINAGPLVNSIGNEITPFFRSDENQLYFASDWHHGFGGYDIFRAVFNGQAFGYPENLKRPFNTPSNDLYYSFNEIIGKGTITSNRSTALHPENEGCCNDLWMFGEKQLEQESDLPEITTLEELNEYLPVKLYFHNDEPNPRTTAVRTSKNYLETYYSYIGMLPAYELEYKKGLNESAGEEAEEAMDRFFINEVDQGVKDLEMFARLLAGELDEGQQIEITVKGFASPLAKSDYNVKLTSRRISSLINYLDQYERGRLLPYLQGTAENGGRFYITEIPFGDYTAGDFVSDNPNDKSNAIYSIAAARERKIEIVSVQRPQADTLTASLAFQTEIIDLGQRIEGDSIPFSFDFTVRGDISFSLDSLSAAGNILLDPATNVYPGGTSGKISGVIVLGILKGLQTFVINMHGNVGEGRRELTIAVEIDEN